MHFGVSGLLLLSFLLVKYDAILFIWLTPEEQAMPWLPAASGVRPGLGPRMIIILNLVGSLVHLLQMDLPREWANLALYRDVWRGAVSRCWVESSVLFYFTFSLSLLFMLVMPFSVYKSKGKNNSALMWVVLRVRRRLEACSSVSGLLFLSPAGDEYRTGLFCYFVLLGSMGIFFLLCKALWQYA